MKTLSMKSKQLALKLKDKANDEETLKKEFDLFWKQCVMNIIKDTPAIRDIDIMRDVKQLLSDIYESVSVDHQTKSSEYNNIFTVPSYSDYVMVKRYSGINAYVMAIWGSMLPKEDEAQIRSLVSDVVQQTE